MVQVCAVNGCRNNSRRNSKLPVVDRTSFHRFPTDPDSSKKWVDFTSNSRLKDQPIDKLKANYYICGAHFLENSFNKNSTKRSLLQGSVPTLNSPTAERLESSLATIFSAPVTKCTTGTPPCSEVGGNVITFGTERENENKENPVESNLNQSGTVINRIKQDNKCVKSYLSIKSSASISNNRVVMVKSNPADPDAQVTLRPMTRTTTGLSLICIKRIPAVGTKPIGPAKASVPINVVRLSTRNGYKLNQGVIIMKRPAPPPSKPSQDSKRSMKELEP